MFIYVLSVLYIWPVSQSWNVSFSFPSSPSSNGLLSTSPARVFPHFFYSPPFSTTDSAILSVYLECSLIQGQAGLSPMGPAVSPSHADGHMLEDTGTRPSTERAIERLRKAYQCNLAGELADTWLIRRGRPANTLGENEGDSGGK